jgi:hypothetical protein
MLTTIRRLHRILVDRLAETSRLRDRSGAKSSWAHYERHAKVRRRTDEWHARARQHAQDRHRRKRARVAARYQAAIGRIIGRRSDGPAR